MDNQHQKISGYSDLSQEEIDLINRIKSQVTELSNLLDDLRALHETPIDMRWAAIGETHLQQRIMALVRSVAKPSGF